MSSIFSSFLKGAKSGQTVGLAEIQEAKQRIGKNLPVTPLTESPALSELLGKQVFLKWENKLPTGSFKERGALNFLLTLDPPKAQKGVCAASAGNHALALSLHAKLLGINCCIVMPKQAPLIKVECTKRNGAEVILHGSNFDEAREYAGSLSKQRGLTLVSPYDHPAIIAGQGTCGLEILDQLDEFDCVVSGVGGGGLISGLSVAIKSAKPKVVIVGVQSEWATGAHTHVKRQSLFPISTIADGIAVKQIGQLPRVLIKDKVDLLVAVSEQEIAKAIVTFLELERSVVEGAGAAGLAALMAGHIPATCERIVLVVSGSNIDMNVLARLIERDMGERGRLLKLIASVPDKPGSLHLTAGVIASAGANILETLHDRTYSHIPGNVDISFLLEVRNAAHAFEVIQAMHAAGIAVKEED